MRLGRPTPMPRLDRVSGGVALIVAGCVVLAAVNTAAAVGFGAFLVTVGLLRLVTVSPAPSRAPGRSPLPHPLLAERIVHQRATERHVRERYWRAS